MGIVGLALKGYAQSQGAIDRYHETLTHFWVCMVYHTLEQTSGVNNVDELVEKFPMLLEKGLPFRHWSRNSFDSAEARKSWVPPDLTPLP